MNGQKRTFTLIYDDVQAMDLSLNAIHAFCWLERCRDYQRSEDGWIDTRIEDIMRFLQCSKRTVHRTLGELVSEGKIESKKRGNITVYKILYEWEGEAT